MTFPSALFIDSIYYLGITLAVLIITALIFLFAIHFSFRIPKLIEHKNPADYGITTYKEIYIPTVGNKKLFAWWIRQKKPAPTLIILHGWGSNAELMLPIALPMHAAGFNILLMDARNHGRSDSASFSSLPRFAEDLNAAINWTKIQTNDPQKRIVLLGHSVGAAAVLLEASKRNDITAVISIASFAHPKWMMQRYLNQYKIPDFCVSWILNYVEWIIGHSYNELAPINTAARIQCPILLVHGTADETIPVSDAQIIKKHSPNINTELILIEGAKHDSVDEIKQHEEKFIGFLKKINTI